MHAHLILPAINETLNKIGLDVKPYHTLAFINFIQPLRQLHLNFYGPISKQSPSLSNINQTLAFFTKL